MSERKQNIDNAPTDASTSAFFKSVDCQTCLFYLSAENSPNIVVLTDIDGYIEYVNKKFCETTGFEKNEAIGKKPSILKSGETPMAEYDHLWKTIKMGIEWRGEIQNKKKTGELYWEHGSIIPIKNAGDEIIKFLAVKQDISENRKIDDEVDLLMAEMDRLMLELDVKNRELSAKNEELDNFAHTVAHDLKSPLATLGSYLLLVKKKIEAKSDVETEMTYLDGMEKSVDRMSNMINVLLSYSSIGRVLEDVQKLEFNRLVEDTLFILQPAIKNRNVEIVLNKSAAIVEGDETLLGDVFQNLIGNAIKYIGDENEAPRVEIGVTEQDGLNVFYVKDNGMGIKEAYLGKLFDLFVRLPETRHIEGTGVGLATVKRIIQSHGGRIWVESVHGQGSTFFFTLNESPAQVAPPSEDDIKF